MSVTDSRCRLLPLLAVCFALQPVEPLPSKASFSTTPIRILSSSGSSAEHSANNAFFVPEPDSPLSLPKNPLTDHKAVAQPESGSRPDLTPILLDALANPDERIF
ncbi:hypothetical protein VDG1235_2968 [Verrucomicrobiia bacterium DG1235]|nr:hypothetical protein VDG1235_2968 [Verrucomicrobiae bacterium DG1235]